MSMEIDIVLLWVDGNDPKWLTEKTKYQGIILDENNSQNRFRDWGLLRYWFRSIEKNAPWVRKVHFVTWGHLPDFINTNNPKLHIVRHDDFIPKEYLPTFSSHTIELNIHRIPGLAEHFIYFNDDMFLLRPLGPDAFFRNGLPCSTGIEVPIALVGKIGTWLHAAVNDMGVVNRHFAKKDSVKLYRNKYLSKQYYWKDNIRTWLLETFFPDYFTGFKNLHAPAAYLKSTFNEVWNKESDLLHSTCKDRFRTSDNVNQWVMLWWQIASGNFEPFVVDNIVALVNNETINMFCDIIFRQDHDFICVNDPDEEVDFDQLSIQLKEAFETVFPDKSEFEL